MNHSIIPLVKLAGGVLSTVERALLRFSVILLGNMEELHQYFGTFGLALWSHFVIVTMETWPDVADAVLEVASPLWGVYFVVSWLSLQAQGVVLQCFSMRVGRPSDMNAKAPHA